MFYRYKLDASIVYDDGGIDADKYVDILYDRLFLLIDNLLLPLNSDVRRSSQTGESTGDRPAFSEFELSSGYNS